MDVSKIGEGRGAESRAQSRQEALTMALYVAISLLAVLAAVPDQDVAVIAIVPVPVSPSDIEHDAVRLVLAALIGVAGYAIAISTGGSRLRAVGRNHGGELRLSAHTA